MLIKPVEGVGDFAATWYVVTTAALPARTSSVGWYFTVWKLLRWKELLSSKDSIPEANTSGSQVCSAERPATGARVVRLRVAVVLGKLRVSPNPRGKAERY